MLENERFLSLSLKHSKLFWWSLRCDVACWCVAFHAKFALLHECLSMEPYLGDLIRYTFKLTCGWTSINTFLWKLVWRQSLLDSTFNTIFDVFNLHQGWKFARKPELLWSFCQELQIGSKCTLLCCWDILDLTKVMTLTVFFSVRVTWLLFIEQFFLSVILLKGIFECFINYFRQTRYGDSYHKT